MEKEFIESVVGIIMQWDKVLLLRRHSYDRTLPNKLCLPGGKKDEGESDLSALIREIKEETKLDVNTATFISAKKWTSASRKKFKIKFYGVSVDNYKITISDEHSSYIWIKLEDLPLYEDQIADETYKVLRTL